MEWRSRGVCSRCGSIAQHFTTAFLLRFGGGGGWMPAVALCGSSAAVQGLGSRRTALQKLKPLKGSILSGCVEGTQEAFTMGGSVVQVVVESVTNYKSSFVFKLQLGREP